MKIRLLAAVAALSACLQLFADPQRVIFDTDMGNDVDDALALAMLYGYASEGEADIAAILISKDSPYSAEFVGIMNCRYGFEIPVGIAGKGIVSIVGGSPDGTYAPPVCDLKNPDGSFKYPRNIMHGAKLMDSVKLARKVLAQSEDGSVVYISVGFSTNIAAILRSEPDDISPLSGRELMAKKIKYFSVMGGQYETSKNAPKVNREFNVFADASSAKFFLENPPAPVFLSGFEVGMELGFPNDAALSGFLPDSPVGLAYKHYCGYKDGKFSIIDTRLWDLTSVLFAFSPEYFDVSEIGTVEVGKGEITKFTPDDSGRCRYLKIPQGTERKIVDELVRRTLFLKK